MTKSGFNSSFVEIQTFEGEKFLKDLKPGDLVLTKDKTFVRVLSIEQRLANPKEQVYNIYYHGKREGVIDRISGECVLIDGKKIKNLKVRDKMLAKSGEIVFVDRIEKMETVNRYFYTIKLEKKSTYCVNNIFIRDIQ